jgi:diguanylate cyclase (GGDEF)-like protein
MRPMPTGARATEIDAPPRRRPLLPPVLTRAVRTGLQWLPRGQSLSEDVWRVRHRTLSYLLRAHVVAIFGFALFRGYSAGQALAYAGIVSVFAVLASTSPQRRGFVSAMNAVGLVTCSAVLVDLSGGVIEMHFHFFVMVGILTLYQDWLPFLLAIGFVVLHHGVLGTLDPKAVYNHPEAIAHPFTWAAVHGAFVLAASAASVVAWRLNEEQAFKDSLTGLPNRALFNDRVSHAFARVDRRPGVLALLFIDLDGFKDVNDSLGHAAGDQLLRLVADRLRRSIRSGDTPARLGGDEFAILLEDLTGEDHAAEVASRVVDALAAPFIVHGQEVNISASVGIALNGRDDDVDSLVRNADVAMYTVKQNGRARYQFYAQEMLTSVVRRVELSQELRLAVDRDQLVVHYQPIVELDTGNARGVEALIRWQHPTRGLLSPAEFMDVADETGAIVRMGAWVLDTACRQARQWQTRFPDHRLMVSVNMSPVQIFQGNVLQTVEAVLAGSGLDAASLVLELTEEVMVKDMDLCALRLHQLNELGIRLAVDDFGTGYSSLNYLTHLPFDVLKIDKGFIDGVTAASREARVAGAIIELAHSFELDTVAEGIQQQAQADTLRDLGCRFAQGSLFAPPLPAAELEAFLAGRPLVPTSAPTGR